MRTEGYILRNAGNPDYGTAYHIMQTHQLSDEVRKRHNVPDLNEKQMLEVGRYQYQILRELQRIGVRDVFAETVVEDMPENLLLKSIDGVEARFGLAYLINQCFLNGCPQMPNTDQIKMLYQFGAPNIYWFLNKGIYLHKTESVRANESGSSSERELETIANIHQFFSAGKMQEAVLVFGAKHDFIKFINPSFNPAFYQKSFDFDESVFPSQQCSLETTTTKFTNFLQSLKSKK